MTREKEKSDSFEVVARRLECDEDKTKFEAKLGKIVRAKPATPAKTRKSR